MWWSWLLVVVVAWLIGALAFGLILWPMLVPPEEE